MEASWQVKKKKKHNPHTVLSSHKVSLFPAAACILQSCRPFSGTNNSHQKQITLYIKLVKMMKTADQTRKSFALIHLEMSKHCRNFLKIGLPFYLCMYYYLACVIFISWWKSKFFGGIKVFTFDRRGGQWWWERWEMRCNKHLWILKSTRP